MRWPEAAQARDTRRVDAAAMQKRHHARKLVRLDFDHAAPGANGRYRVTRRARLFVDQSEVSNADGLARQLRDAPDHERHRLSWMKYTVEPTPCRIANQLRIPLG